jgi:hypothetical protein
MQRIVGLVAIGVAVLSACTCKRDSVPAGPAVAPDVKRVIDRPVKVRAAEDALPHLSYVGGPVLSHVKVKAVLWGSSTGLSSADLTAFWQTITQQYVPSLDEYRTVGVTGSNGSSSNQGIGAGSFLGVTAITPTSTSKHLSESDVLDELTRQIDTGNLPAPTDETVYMMYFASDTSVGNICVAGGRCGAHDYFVHNNQKVLYAYVGTCCATSIVASHELAESVTNPNSDHAPYGWRDPTTGYEIGDICSNQSASYGSFTVQREWSNVHSSCYVPPFCDGPLPCDGRCCATGWQCQNKQCVCVPYCPDGATDDGCGGECSSGCPSTMQPCGDVCCSLADTCCGGVCCGGSHPQCCGDYCCGQTESCYGNGSCWVNPSMKAVPGTKGHSIARSSVDGGQGKPVRPE